MTVETLGEILATVWTVWAVLLFGGIFRWAYRPANRARFQRDACIPLHEEG